MRALSDLSLGLRLATGGGRQAAGRLLLMSAGVAVGVALLIGGLGIGPALQARHARQLARQPVWVDPADHPANYLRWALGFDRIGEQDMLVYSVRAVGAAPVPPGLSRVPAEGEIFVSRALADALRTPPGRIAARRLPGRVAGTVGLEGLSYPQELVAYVGAPASAFGPGESLAVGFGPTEPLPREPVPFGVKLLVVVGVAGLLVPTLVFVATSTRLSAASRERRLAAIRLVGATPAQTRLLAAVESGLGAAAGSVLGLGLFFALRPVVASISLADYRWFPGDIAPPVWQAALVLVAAPALAVAASIISLRRLILSPLGVARRARVRRTGARRLLPMAAGLAGLGLAWLLRVTTNQEGAGSLALMGLSFVLLLAGLAWASPWLGSGVAGLATRGEAGPGRLLGARRVQADPTSSGRVVGAMALLVFAAGVVHSFATPTGIPAGDIGQLLRPGAAVISGEIRDAAAFDRRLLGVAGVAASVPIVQATHRGTEAAGGFGIWIADCADLRRALAVPLPECTPETGYASSTGAAQLRGVAAGSVLSFTTEGPGPRRRLQLRVPPQVRAGGDGTGLWQLGTDIIFPTSSLVRGTLERVSVSLAVVVTDGEAVTLERVRNAAAAHGLHGSVRTLQDARQGSNRTARQIASLINLGVLVAMGIALANLLIVSVDHVQEGRRPMAALAATGVPLRVLRRSVAVEIGLPLAAAVALAAGLALAVSLLLGGIVQEPTRLPLVPLGALAALTVATVAVVTALTFPALARASRPETLRTE